MVFQQENLERLSGRALLGVASTQESSPGGAQMADCQGVYHHSRWEEGKAANADSHNLTPRRSVRLIGDLPGKFTSFRDCGNDELQSSKPVSQMTERICFRLFASP
jgi:hypothetical protein